MNIVLDTSAAVKIVLDRDISLINILLEAECVYVPRLYFAEAGSVFSKYHQFQNMPPDDCKAYIIQCQQLATDVFDENNFTGEIFDISISNHLSFYDAIYLTMALLLDAKLVTIDKKLKKVAEESGLLMK